MRKNNLVKESNVTSLWPQNTSGPTEIENESPDEDTHPSTHAIWAYQFLNASKGRINDKAQDSEKAESVATDRTNMDSKIYTDLKIDVVVEQIKGFGSTLDTKIEGLSGKLDARMDGLSNQLRTEVGAVQSELARKPSRSQVYGAVALAFFSALTLLVAIVVAFVQFGGDSFQGGFGAASTFSSELTRIDRRLDNLVVLPKTSPATPRLGGTKPFHSKARAR